MALLGKLKDELKKEDAAKRLGVSVESQFLLAEIQRQALRSDELESRLDTASMVFQKLCKMLSGEMAKLVVQDLTYKAVIHGSSGDHLTIEYVGGETAGAETVTITGLDIVVGIEDGVSTADQIAAVVNSNVDKFVQVEVSGTGATVQTVAGAPKTNLKDGWGALNKPVRLRTVF